MIHVTVHMRLLALPLFLSLAVGCSVVVPRLSARSGNGELQQRAVQNSDKQAWFEDRAATSGIDFRLGHHGKSPLPVLDLMGTGCASCDLDGDGNADIFVVGATGISDGGRCALYRNKGDGTFVDVTKGSGLEGPGFYMGCAVADIDNDGRPDILLTGYGVVRLFHNLGGMKFEDITDASGLAAKSPSSWATSAAFFDFDRDGLVDVYIGRYIVFNEHALQYCKFGDVKAACGPIFYDPQQGSLYRNLGQGRFEDVTSKCGLDSAHGKCLGVAFADVDGDGWPDLYLANDEMTGDLFMNKGGKRFVNTGVEAGVALSAEGDMQGGMGVDFGDFDRSGHLSLFVSTFEGEADGLYVGTGYGSFQNRSLPLGIDALTRRLVGFGTRFVDVDNAGWPDLVIANGHIRDNEEQVDSNTHYRQPMQLLMNQRGKQFADASASAGPGFTTPGVGRGLAVADFDNDGREDIVAVDLEGPVRLLMNRCPTTNHWIRVQLRGKRSNRMGIGARVVLVAGADRRVGQCTTAGSYLSASDPRIHFGLGSQTHVDRIEVDWPSGAKSITAAPRIDGDITIQEP